MNWWLISNIEIMKREREKNSWWKERIFFVKEFRILNDQFKMMIIYVICHNHVICFFFWKVKDSGSNTGFIRFAPINHQDQYHPQISLSKWFLKSNHYMDEWMMDFFSLHNDNIINFHFRFVFFLFFQRKTNNQWFFVCLFEWCLFTTTVGG